MTLTWQNLWLLLRLTVTDPGRAAGLLLQLPMTGAGRLAALGVVSALSALLLWGTYAAFPMTMPDGRELEPVGPLTWAMMVGAGVFLLTGLIYLVGRLAGGRARFGDLVLLLAWFQFVQMSLYIGQIVLLVLLPPLGMLVTLASLGLTVWILAHMIRVAHGFGSVLGPLMGIVGGTVLIFVLLLGGA